MRKPIAIAVSDIHLSMKAPACRIGEPNWFSAMRRPLEKIRILSTKHRVPVLCGGDVFDKWKSPPELINFAIENLPDMYSIPGQHDIPNHSIDHLSKSAYTTIVQSRNIVDVRVLRVPKGNWGNEDGVSLLLHGFPWGSDLSDKKEISVSGTKIAIVHKYIWKDKQHKYIGAGEDQHTSKLKEALKGYDFAIFGDNHYPFTTMVGDCRVVNCGGMMIRKTSDIRPCAWILYDNKDVEPVHLDSPEDVVDTSLHDVDEDKEEARNDRFQKVLDDLEALGSEVTNFSDTLKRAAESCSESVRDIIYNMMEDGK